jgi:hypothetical protein
MVTTDLDAFTSDKYQVSTFPHIKHPGYCYIPLQVNPQIAPQFIGSFWGYENQENYLWIANDETGEITSYITPYFNQNAPFILHFGPYFNQVDLLAFNYDRIDTLLRAYYFDEPFDAVSSDTLQSINIYSHVKQIMLNFFKSYLHEEFDSDIAYYFTNDLEKLVLTYGKPSIMVINNIIGRKTLNHNLINEILKALGRIEDTETKNIRFDILISLLKSVSPTIRDGAVSGLSFLDDNRALPQLRLLYERETAPILKGNIKVAIESLEL